MKHVIEAIMRMLHRKGIVTDEELLKFEKASLEDENSIFGEPWNVVSAINKMGYNDKGE